MKGKNRLYVILSALLVVTISLILVGCSKKGNKRNTDIAILYTGDVHCAVDGNLGYTGLAAFKKELEQQGVKVLLVDTGDAIQGGTIGTLSEGLYPIQIMNQMGYCAMALGNHEFDYGQEVLSKLSEEAKFPFLSLNFKDIESGKPVYEPYTLVECDGIKIAFIGITTPTTLTGSTPTYFMDENRNYKYTFLQDNSGKELWDATQQSVDAARKEGADYVIALAHLGIDSSASPYLSTDLIANTSGIDVVLDGHSHSVIECERVQNKEGKRILLTSTGSRLNHIGYLLLDRDGNLSTGLVSDAQKDSDISAYIDGLKAEFEQKLGQTLATIANDLVTDDPATGVRIIRNAETNLGNLCADAIRAAAGTDIAFINGGGIRTSLKAGEITYGDILNVYPFGNHLCVLEVTGQDILDALELSVSTVPNENGGFLHVSGMTFIYRSDIPSTVVKDSAGMFAGVEGERRVQNVFVGGEPLKADKTYTLASITYTLLDGGDGFSMFVDCPVLVADLGLDYDILLNYLTGDYLKNTTLYAGPYGEGRIVALP